MKITFLYIDFSFEVLFPKFNARTTLIRLFKFVLTIYFYVVFLN